MIFLRNISLRIYAGPLATGLKEEPLVAAGTVPEEFRAIPPTIVDETQTWIITHAQNYTLYALHTRACKTSDGQPGQMQVCLLLPTQQRLADGKSPMEVLNSISAAFSIQAMMGGDELPDSPVDSSPYQNLLRRYRLEQRPTSLPVMNGHEAAAYCVENMTQLEALMRHSRYPELGHVGRLELGTHCQSTISINTKAAARPAKQTQLPSGTPADSGENVTSPTPPPPPTPANNPAAVPTTPKKPDGGSMGAGGLGAGSLGAGGLGTGSTGAGSTGTGSTGTGSTGAGSPADIPDFIKAIQNPHRASGQPATPHFTPPAAPTPSSRPSQTTASSGGNNSNGKKWLFIALGAILSCLIIAGIMSLCSNPSSEVNDDITVISEELTDSVEEKSDDAQPSDADEIRERLTRIAEEEAARREAEEAERIAREESKKPKADEEAAEAPVIQEEEAPAPRRENAGRSAAQEELLRLINDDEVKLWTCRTSDGYNNTLNRREQLAVDAVKGYYDENTRPLVNNILSRYKPFRSIDEVVRASDEIKKALEDF
ncbi:MAG: hypothetical protein K6F94_09425 [Bacteroidaceae bacterium]|nr:hypothetical protein [Bacteroidaceae bacterium]